MSAVYGEPYVVVPFAFRKSFLLPLEVSNVIVVALNLFPFDLALSIRVGKEKGKNKKRHKGSFEP